MEIILILLKWFFMLLGLTFIAIATLGLFRMPDIYTKQHALSLIDTLGFFSISISIMITLGLTLVTFKVFFLAVLVLLLSAPSCYTLMQILVRKNNIVSAEIMDNPMNDKNDTNPKE